MAKADGKLTKVTQKVMKCNCQHEFQDQKYGKGMRMFKIVEADKGRFGVSKQERCTVCFSRPYALGGHGSLILNIKFRYAAWPLHLLPMSVSDKGIARVLRGA